MQLFTTSRSRDWNACHRLHRYKYEDLRRPIRQSEPLLFGRVSHDGLEQRLLARMEGRSQAEGYDLMMAGARASVAGLGEDVDFSEYDHARIFELLRGWHYRWSDWLDTVEVLAVEVEFCCPLVNPATGRVSRTWALAGKIDAILLVDGEVWIMEHKTTTKDVTPGAMYWLRLRIDGQVTCYFEGAASLGHEVAGCLYNVLRKPQIKPRRATPEENKKFTKGKGCKECGGSAGGKKGIMRGSGLAEASTAAHPVECIACDGIGWKEAPRLHANLRDEDETVEEFAERIRELIVADPDAWYQHGDVRRLAEELDEYRADAWITAKSIREAQLTGGHARNPDACDRYNRLCEYFDVCCSGANIDDDGRFRTVKTAHTELSVEKRKTKWHIESTNMERDG